METFIDNTIEYLNQFPSWAIYIFFFISGALQIFFPPYPGDSLLLLGGYFGSRGLYGGPLPLFLSYFLATVVFSYLLFELGYWKGEGILNYRLVAKYITVKDQDKVRRVIDKYGVFVYLVSKFIPGIGFITILISGILRHQRRWAYMGILVASFLHNLLFYLVGRKVGESWEHVRQFLSTYNKIALVVIIVAIIGYAVFSWLKKSRREKA